MTLNLVLVEPAGARNVGSVARLRANFGVAEQLGPDRLRRIRLAP